MFDWPEKMIYMLMLESSSSIYGNKQPEQTDLSKRATLLTSAKPFEPTFQSTYIYSTVVPCNGSIYIFIFYFMCIFLSTKTKN